ncbi:MAG: lamin tail domain-containing protein [Anaerolineales bacterium]|nr:lamin tail domain-containing protein [Anaerolineales bacterium]
MQKQAPLFRALLASALLTLLCAGLFVPRVEQQVGAAPYKTLANHIVISEFRTRGQLGGNDEFIELHNPTLSSIDISGWQVWGSNANTPIPGTSNRKTIPASTVIPAGGYYLITHTGSTYAGTADTTYGTGISDDGGIAIFTSFDLVTPIDQVGMNNNSAYKEGAVLGELSGTANQSYERIVVGIGGNCEDTENNLSDFIWNSSTSNPQNSSSAISSCAPSTATPTNTETPTITTTPTETGTSTPTGSATATFTTTSTPTITLTPNCTLSNTSTPLSLVINEIAWAGTAASTGDEWIEIYNPAGGIGCTNLTGWVLRSEDGSPSISLSGVIQDDGYFLLERTDDTTVSDITADQIYTGELSNSGEKLYLENNGIRIDSANIDGGSWPAGSTSTFGSMERLMKSGVIVSDSPTTWLTNTGVVKNGLDAGLPNGCTVSVNCTTNPRAMNGTPRAQNWAAAVTPTPSRTATSTRTSTPLPTAVPVGRPVINEFLPRPGFDWNQDGNVDVFDEFIEIKNLGPVDINLGGWKLDDEANLGSNPFTLPSVTLKPGERIAFYGLQTNILLSDGGDTVRLLNSNNKVYDSRTYKIAKVEDQSVCRLFPDGSGSWYEDCIPTPNLINSRDGEVPVMPDAGFESPVCDLPDTLPEAFLIAECRGYGANLWRTMFWDASGWGNDVFVPANRSKWESFVE